MFSAPQCVHKYHFWQKYQPAQWRNIIFVFSQRLKTDAGGSGHGFQARVDPLESVWPDVEGRVQRDLRASRMACACLWCTL